MQKCHVCNGCFLLEFNNVGLVTLWWSVLLINIYRFPFRIDMGIHFYEVCLRKAVEYKEELDEAKVLTGYGKVLTNIKASYLHSIYTYTDTWTKSSYGNFFSDHFTPFVINCLYDFWQKCHQCPKHFLFMYCSKFLLTSRFSSFIMIYYHQDIISQRGTMCELRKDFKEQWI